MKALSIPAGIAREEGWLLVPKPGARPPRCIENLNPGNLDFEAWMEVFGGELETTPPGEVARFAKFPSAVDGFAALRHLCGFPEYRGQTLAHLVSAWAPPSENNTSVYLLNVSAWTELPASTVIDNYLGDPADDPAPGAIA